jgi:hypothetical protein
MTDDQKYWRNRATKMRSVAVTMADSHAGILLNDLALHYDELANRAATSALGVDFADPVRE